MQCHSSPCEGMLTAGDAMQDTRTKRQRKQWDWLLKFVAEQRG